MNRNVLFLALLLAFSGHGLAIGYTGDQIKDTKFIESELKAKPDLIKSTTATPSNTWTLLHAAAAFGHLDTVRLLLQKGADVHAKNDLAETPLALAVKYGSPHSDPEVVKTIVSLLLNGGAKINQVDSFGGTALEAVYNSKEALVGDEESFKRDWLIKFLESKGGIRTLPPITEAIIKGDLDRVKEVILGHPESINKFDASHRTPLMRAAEKGNVEIIKLLLAAGADINLRDDYSGAAALNFAKNKEAIEYLKSKGAQIGEPAGD